LIQALSQPSAPAVQAARDTLFVVQQQAGWQGWIDVLASVATIVVAVALLMVGLGAIFAGLKVRKLMKKLEEATQKLRVDLAPAIHHVTSVSENVDFVSRTVRKDVERLSETVTSANQSLQRAAREAERRAAEFNALLGVVQEEAEDLLLGGAAAIRGAKVGAETFRRFRAEDGDDEEEFEYEDDFADDDELADEDELAGEDGWGDEGPPVEDPAAVEDEPPPPAPRRKRRG